MIQSARICKLSTLLIIFLVLSAVTIIAIPVNAAVGKETTTPQSRSDLFIEISIGSKLLTLYEKNGAEPPVMLRQYPVGTVARGLNTYPVGLGEVTAIAFNPWWYPTPYSRTVFRERGIELMSAVPPGHPLNYMGPFKISLSHRTIKGAIYRIHGNNNPQRVGKRVTGGCFVMDNESGLELARTIKVGTEVNILP